MINLSSFARSPFGLARLRLLTRCARSSISRRIALAACGVLMASSASATTMVELTTEDLAHLAEAIVVAEIKDVQMKADGGRVLTHNSADVLDVWKGDVKRGDRLTVVEFGGVMGDVVMDVPGTAGFLKNERVVLFLERKIAGGWNTIGLRQGKRTLAPNGAGGYVVTDVAVSVYERGAAFNAKRHVTPEKLARGGDLAALATEVKTVVEADRKAGIRGRDLLKYKGLVK